MVATFKSMMKVQRSTQDVHTGEYTKPGSAGVGGGRDAPELDDAGS